MLVCGVGSVSAQVAKPDQSFAWRLNPGQTGFDLSPVGANRFAVEGLSGAVEIDGKKISLKDSRLLRASGSATSMRFDYQLAGTECHWTWDLASRDDGLELTATLQNLGTGPVVLGKWDVLSFSGSAVRRWPSGEAPGDVRFFRWRPWDVRVETLDADGGRHWSDNLFLLVDPGRQQAFLSAFLTMDRMHTRHSITYTPSAGISSYQATCSFGAYVLSPGNRLVSEKLRLSYPRDPYKALEDWAERIRIGKNPSFAKLPPVGLKSYAWVDPWKDEGYAADSLANARAVREKLRGFDVEFFRVNTWVGMDQAIPGNWTKASERHFRATNGYVGFLRELQQLGFKPAVWAAPFWFFGEAEDTLAANRENLLRDHEGKPITEIINWAGDLGDVTSLSALHKYYLDGTHPKSADFIRKVFAWNRELGVRFYMLDFLQVPTAARLYDPTQTPLQAAIRMLSLIRETAGNDTHLQTAVSSTPAFSGLIDAVRVGRDFGEGRPLQGGPQSHWRNSTYVLHDDHYANLAYLLQNTASSYFTHRKLYINDLNDLTVDRPLPLEHARIATTIFGLSGSPLMLDDDFRRIDDERLRLIKLCLPRTNGMPVPVDLFEHVFPQDYARYLKLEVPAAWDQYQLVAVFEAYHAELDFAQSGLEAVKAYRVFEFWNGVYEGTYRERYKTVIPPHSCRLFRLAEARNYPWLLSSDMHIQQGAVEVEALQWDAERRRLSGTVTRPMGERGSLYFLMPRKMRVVNDQGLYLLKELEDMNVIIRKDIRFTKEKESFELFFEPWEEKYVVAKGLMPYATEAEWLDYARKRRAPGDTRVIE